MRLLRVRGTSMSPTLADGDFILVRQGSPRAGDVVAARHPGLGLIVKRLVTREADGRWRLAGDGALSSASEALGPIQPGAIIGRAILRISRHGIGRISGRYTSRGGD